MRFLPFSFVRGSTLALLARAALEDPRRRCLCAFCGGMVPIRPEIARQTVRCPSCWRRQRIVAGTEGLARLSPDALAGLRRTTGWVRRWPEG